LRQGLGIRKQGLSERVQGPGYRVQKAWMMRGRKSTTAVALAAVLMLAGCRQDMHNQPKFVPQRGTTFFADGRSARPQVANTIARNQLDEGSYFETGIVGGKEGDGLPIALTQATIERGQERFNIYCTPCHSRVGNGVGMIVQRGYRPAGNFHTDRLRNAPLGHFFAVMTNGYGAMPDYSAQLTPEDRWAVAAYIRALQLSQDAKPGDVASDGHVQDLHSIAHDAGMPPGFADPWALPSTAIYGTPNNDDNGIPGQPMGTPPAGYGAHKGQAATEGSGQRDSGGEPTAPVSNGTPYGKPY
jgi:mono/diheme cytochrome c family protein